MEHYLQQLNVQDMMQQLDSFFPGFQLDFSQLLQLVLGGDWKEAASLLVENLGQSFWGQAAGMRGLMASILLLGVLSVLVTGFLAGFENQQTAQLAYTVFYLLLLAILFGIFSESYRIAQQLLETTTQFSRLVFPAFCLSVGTARGSLTAVGYYELAMLFIALAGSLFLKICLPLLSAFMLLLLMNGIWEEGKLSALMALLEKGIQTAVKGAVAAITGLGFLHSMVSPALDGLKRNAAQKVIAAIPGLGGLAEGTTEVLLGSAVLVKNAIGLFALLILIALVAIPCLKLFLYGLLLKVSGALMGVVTDRRLTACVSRTGDAIWLLLRVCLAGAACFFILVAIITCLAGG